MSYVIDANGDVQAFANGDVATEDCLTECCGGGPPSPGQACCQQNTLPCGWVPVAGPPFTYDRTITLRGTWTATNNKDWQGGTNRTWNGTLPNGFTISRSVEFVFGETAWTNRCNASVANTLNFSDGLPGTVITPHQISQSGQPRLIDRVVTLDDGISEPQFKFGNVGATVNPGTDWSETGTLFGGISYDYDGGVYVEAGILVLMVRAILEIRTGQVFLGLTPPPNEFESFTGVPIGWNLFSVSQSVSMIRNGSCPRILRTSGSARF